MDRAETVPLRQSLFFKKETLALVFSCEFFEIFKSIYFEVRSFLMEVVTKSFKHSVKRVLQKQA